MCAGLESDDSAVLQKDAGVEFLEKALRLLRLNRLAAPLPFFFWQFGGSRCRF